MFNIIDLCTKGVSSCFNGTCYIFGRVAECCCGKPRATLAGNPGNDDPLVEFDSQEVNSRSLTFENEVRNRFGQQPNLPIQTKNQDLISPEQKLIAKLIVDMENFDWDVSLRAMMALREIINEIKQTDCKAEGINARIKAIIIQFTNILEDIGSDIFFEDRKSLSMSGKLSVQVDILVHFRRLLESYSDQEIQDCSVLDTLVICLIGKFDHTNDSGQRYILEALEARERCVVSSNSEILKREKELMTSILANPEKKFLHRDAQRMLESYDRRGKKYSWL